MKRFMLILAVIGAGLCNPATRAAAQAECFANPAAVFAAHPNAAHASYTLRAKRSGRCWYADAFKTEAKAQANTKPAPRRVARTSAPRPANATSASHQRTAAVAPAPHQRATPVALASQPLTTAVAPTPPPVTSQFPNGLPPAIQIAVNPREVSRLLPVGEPADFESRFSVSGYKARK
jgi:hypothetical protein